GRKHFQGLLRFVMIVLVARVSVQSQQRDSRGRITRRRRRVLEGFATRAQHTQNFLIGAPSFLGVEEAPRDRVEEKLEHRVSNPPSEVEIGKVCGGLISIETRDGTKGIVVEQGGDMPSLRVWVGISDDVCQSSLSMPAFCENAIERTQSKPPRRFEVECLGRFQIRRNAKRVPSRVNSFVYVRSGPLQTC